MCSSQCSVDRQGVIRQACSQAGNGSEKLQGGQIHNIIYPDTTRGAIQLLHQNLQRGCGPDDFAWRAVSGQLVVHCQPLVYRLRLSAT